MRKNYIYLFLVFLLSISMFGQKVTLTPTLVNGVGFDGNSINLGGTPYSSISLGVKVEMPTIPGNNGTVTIYVVNGLSTSVAIGGSSLPLFFGEGKTANQSFIINISWGSISELGGQIYAEYKTSSNIAYKSGYIKVTKNPTMNSGGANPPADAPNPTKIPNTLCCNQTVRLGDKPTPITGSQYPNPYQDQSYGINSSWETNGNKTASILNLDNVSKTLYIDYITEPENFTVTRSLGYNDSNVKSNKSNTVTITIVPTPILSNNITATNASNINSDGFIEFSNLKSIDFIGHTSFVNLNILKDPTHTPQRTDELSSEATYTWEYSNLRTSKLWIPITSSNPSNLYGFTPPNSNSEDNYYAVRRIATYKGISRVSNEIKIMTRAMGNNNTICCDQSLKILSLTQYENPNTITGSTPIFDNTNIPGNNLTINSFSYQWQVQTLSRDISTWTDIPSATDKDYLPTQPLKIIGNGRGGYYSFESTYKYRRIVKFNYKVVANGSWVYGTTSTYSNEISLDGNSKEAYITIYPNPTSSILNIQSSGEITNAKISITNIIGNTTYYTPSITNSNLISIDISQLMPGTYFLNIDNQGIYQKTFIKQ